MMRRTVALIGILVGVVGLPGCGGGSHGHPKRTPAYYPTVVPGHPCAPRDFYQQCALRRFGAPQTRARLAPSVVLARGVDYAWSQPSCASFHANGWGLAATYFDTYDRAKGWSPAKVGAMDACHVAKVAVWETGSLRATAGYYAGRTDAQLALAEAEWVRWQPGRPIFYAIDCDCSGGSVQGYFGGVKSVMDAVHRPTGAYGGYRPLNYLLNVHLITYGWQTYAWSGGAWDPRACLEQWLNSNAVDYDRAICKDYGQTPYNAKPPGPTPQQVTHWRNARESSWRAWGKRVCSSHLTRADCYTFGVKRTLYFQAKLRAVEKPPHCFGPGAALGNHTCQVARPYVSRWSQARDATDRVLTRKKCSQRSIGNCRQLQARDRRYRQLIAQYQFV